MPFLSSATVLHSADSTAILLSQSYQLAPDAFVTSATGLPNACHLAVMPYAMCLNRFQNAFRM